MIHPAQIESVVARIDLPELIGEFVSLKKSGSSFQGLCPFHTEKSPSFKVFTDHYHCFGCGAHGNALEFAMQTQRLSFPDAVKALANRLGMELETTQPALDSHQGLRETLRVAVGEYQRQLMHCAGNPGMAELVRRGVDSDSIFRYGLGYAPQAWDTLLKHKGSGGIKRLLECGLVSPRINNKGYYDRFRNRLMFPVSDESGRPVGFGGRRLSDTDGSGPKYLNSPETSIYHKGEVLFGLPQALPFIREQQKVIVVEGYFDVIVPAQHGVEPIVSTCGTSLTEENAETLLRIAPDISLCFDGDKAGRAATWRAARLILPLLRDEHTVRLCTLPAEHDPDSFVRSEGAAAFMELTDQAPSLCSYLLDAVCDVPTSPEARARTIRVGVEIFKSIRQAHVLRQLFRTAFCQRMSVAEGTFNLIAHALDSHGLSPCPFCGGPGLLENQRVVCQSCGCFGAMADDDGQAMRAWNTRN